MSAPTLDGGATPRTDAKLYELSYHEPSLDDRRRRFIDFARTLELEAADLRRFHDACIKELYGMLGIDGTDGEYRFKWVAVALSAKLRQLERLRDG